MGDGAAARGLGRAQGGAPPDFDQSQDVLRRAVDEGFQLIDTADCYGPEISETLIAEALRPYLEDVVVSTKGDRLALGDNGWRPDGRPEHLWAACEASLRRAQTGARISSPRRPCASCDIPGIPSATSRSGLLLFVRLGRLVGGDKAAASVPEEPAASLCRGQGRRRRHRRRGHRGHRDRGQRCRRDGDGDRDMASVLTFLASDVAGWASPPRRRSLGTDPKPIVEGLLGGIYLRLLVTREPLDDEFLVGLAEFLTARGAGR